MKIDFTHLSQSECILLAEELWEHALSQQASAPLTRAQSDEMNRRLDAIESGDMTEGESWDVVRARLARR